VPAISPCFAVGIIARSGPRIGTWKHLWPGVILWITPTGHQKTTAPADGDALEDGAFVDIAVVRQAERLLAEADRGD
jgi:hypothetical protein